MTRGKMILFAGAAALALVLAFGCSLLPREESGAALGYSIKLQIQAPAASKGITVGEFDVTGLHIEVLGSGGEPLANIDWAAEEGKEGYDVPVPQPGEYRIVVTHLGGSEEAPVQATEEAAFEIRAMKITVIDIVPGAIGTILVEGGNGGGTISGRVYDWVTGAGISGATVVFGNYSGTTDLSGTYSITVPDSVSSVQGVFAAFKGLEYSSCAGGTISVDPTTDPVYDIALGPSDASGYIDRNLSGRIYDDADAEIASNSRIQLVFLNEAGGQWWTETHYQAGSGYVAATKAYGSSCFVVVVVKDEFDDALFQFYLTGQDLASDRTDYDLSQPTTGFTSVTLNGTQGSSCERFLIVPNYGWVDYAGVDLTSSSHATQEIYNPENYPMCWMTQTVEENTPAQDENTAKVSALIMPFSDTINLPPVYTHPAPSASVDGATVSWNAGTRTFSFDPVAGANAYLVFLNDNSNRHMSFLLASSSITLPSELVTAILEPGSGWDVVIWPTYSPQAAPDKLMDFIIGSLDSGEDHAPNLEIQGALIQSSNVTKVDAIP